MKNLGICRLLPLFIAGFVILTSMSECEKNNLVHHTVDNPVSAKIDGVLFRSQPEQVLNAAGDVHQLIEGDNDFIFHLVRRISSDDRYYTIYIEMICDEPFELNRKYQFHGDGTEDYFITGSLLDSDGQWLQHTATSGRVEFTDLSKGDHWYVSGNFEMDCVDSDGTPIQIKDGQFGPLRVYYDSNKWYSI